MSFDEKKKEKEERTKEIESMGHGGTRAWSLIQGEAFSTVYRRLICYDWFGFDRVLLLVQARIYPSSSELFASC